MFLKRNGFSLIELILVILLIGILAFVSLPMLTSGFRAFTQQRATAEAEREALLALERVSREVRMAKQLGIAGGGNELAYTRTATGGGGDDCVTLTHTGGALEISVNGGTAGTVAANLPAPSGAVFELAASDSDACYLKFAFSTTMHGGWRQILYLRNLSSCESTSLSC